MNKADVIFHPVRIRIVQALFGDRRLTAQQLAAALGGPSIATLYRHLNRLVEAGILAVVEERPVRGTLEKVYALPHPAAANISAAELRALDPDQHLRHFTTLVGTLLSDFGRYVAQPDVDLGAERLLVRQEALRMTDAEARQLRVALLELLAPYMQNPADADRRRYLLTTVLIPEVEPTAADAAEE